ncbi:hypothetical protein B9Z19DRAFT_1122177 [Tuber borchii]|uniref:Uncharacterized protein n=1 Tax=Tuber borchii TaxID=42251 RepID=A0A2T7A106_TUBBO|nr:hypothetical protein B9Z19DRAFT_1122177 [Tuber borchii]
MPGPNLVKPNPDNQPVSLVSIPESSYIAELAEKAYEKGSTALLRLKASARVRDVVLRPEKQAKDIVWNRIANHEAILGHTRGILQDKPCKTCEQMIGPFADCVAVTGEFLGSCTNCHYNSCGKRCSFRLPAHTPGSKRKRSVSDASFAEPGNACEPTPKTAKTAKENRAQEFAMHWDGLSGIIRDFIVEKVFGTGA